MAEREEYEEYEDEPRPRRVATYAPLTTAEHAQHDRALAEAEREDAEEQLADDIEQLRARRVGYQSPYAAPGLPLSPQQAERERALDAHIDDAQPEDEAPLPPRRRGLVEGRVHGTYTRLLEEEEFTEWAHERGLVADAAAVARWRAERATDDGERVADEPDESAVPEDAEVVPEPRRPGVLSRGGKSAGRAVGGALRDLDRRLGDDHEHEEHEEPTATTDGWLDGRSSDLGQWRSGTLEEWIDEHGARSDKGWW